MSKEPGGEGRSKAKSRLIGGALLAILAVSAQLSGTLNGATDLIQKWGLGHHGKPAVHSPAPTPNSSPTSKEVMPVVRDLTLNASNFCAWAFGSNPIPAKSLHPLIFRVDARCNTPKDPNPRTDAGARVFAGVSLAKPLNSRVRDGETVKPICFSIGDVIQDDASPQNASRIWIRIMKPYGMIPDVNFGGGYSIGQLESVGLRHC